MNESPKRRDTFNVNTGLTQTEKWERWERQVTDEEADHNKKQGLVEKLLNRLKGNSK